MGGAKPYEADCLTGTQSAPIGAAREASRPIRRNVMDAAASAKTIRADVLSAA